MPTRQELQQLQSLPLAVKIRKTIQRIKEWVDHFGIDGVYVSFSGGKDSTVLLHIVRQLYPNMKAAYVDTGLENPEIREFVRQYENVDWLKPKKNFKQVILEYGYPLISKEVAECVSGARKYLTKVRELYPELTDRRLPYSFEWEKLTGTGRYAKPNDGVLGGQHQRIPYNYFYRKLTGIGEYSTRQKQETRRSLSHSSDSGNVGQKQSDSYSGEYP